MSLIQNTETQESRKFWVFVLCTAAEVRKWPAWKRGNVPNQETDAEFNQRAIKDLRRYQDAARAECKKLIQENPQEATIIQKHFNAEIKKYKRLEQRFSVI